MSEYPVRFIRMPEVMKITGLAKRTIYKYISEGKFPKSRKVSTRAVMWPESEVVAWVQKYIDNN